MKRIEAVDIGNPRIGISINCRQAASLARALVFHPGRERRCCTRERVVFKYDLQAGHITVDGAENCEHLTFVPPETKRE